MPSRFFGEYTQRRWAEDVRRFLDANKDHPTVSEHGVRVEFTLKLDPVHNRAGIQLTVCIDDNTRQGHIKKSWKFVEEWRRRLHEWQGKEGDAFTDYLLELREQDVSWAEIAKSVNSDIAEAIREAVLTIGSSDTVSPFMAVQMNAVFVLLSRLGEDGSAAFFEEATKNVINGRAVFNGLNEPATEENIRGIIRGQITRKGW